MHYSTNTPKDHRRVRSRCGIWSLLVTSDPDRVTCGSCLRLLALDKKRPAMMNPIATLISVAALLLAACGPAPAVDATDADSASGSTYPSGESSSTGASDTSSSTSGEAGSDGSSSEGSIAASTTDSPSTGEDTSDASTSGEDSTGSTGGESAGTTGEDMGACFAESCSADVPCKAGMACVPSLDNATMICAPLCDAGGGCHVDFCSEVAPEVACLPDAVTGASRCFPV